MSLAQVSSPDIKTSSSLEVKKKDGALRCDNEEDISIQYTVVGEAQGSVDIMYLVSGGLSVYMMRLETPKLSMLPRRFCVIVLCGLAWTMLSDSNI